MDEAPIPTSKKTDESTPTSDLGTLMHLAFRKLRRTWSSQLEPWDLTPFQWRTLRSIHSGGGSLRPGEIADKLHIVPRSATEVIDQLEEKKLIERRTDPKDRRAIQVSLTSQSDHLISQILEERQSLSEQFFAILSAKEQEQLSHLLSKLSKTPGQPHTSNQDSLTSRE